MTELPRLLNLAGLLLGMVGVLVIFKWGPPQPDFSEGIALGLEPATVFVDGTKVSDLIEAARRLKRRHSIMSGFGLGLIGFGFLAQFIATILEPTP
jgi:hypothetical protein